MSTHALEQLQESLKRDGHYYNSIMVINVMVVQVKNLENTFFRIIQKQYNMDMLELLALAAMEQHILSTQPTWPYHTLEGLDLEIDPDRPPKNFKDTMSRKDGQERTEELTKDFCCFKDCKALAFVKSPKE
jgi:hypothetical protein